MHLGPCNKYSILMCTSLLQRNSVPLNVLPLKIDTPLLLHGLLPTWAAAHPATPIARSNGFLLLGDKVGSRSMGEGGLLGASREFGGKSRVERM